MINVHSLLVLIYLNTCLSFGWGFWLLDGKSGILAVWNWELSLNSRRFWYLLEASEFVTIIGPFDTILLMQRPISLPIYLHLYVWLYEWSFYVSNDVDFGYILLFKWLVQFFGGVDLH